MAMSGLSGAGEAQSHDSHGISEASEAGEASFAWDSVEGAPPTRHGQKQHSPEDMRRRNVSKKAKRRAAERKNSSELRVSAGPTGLAVPEILEEGNDYLEAAASSMALDAPLGDDGPSGVVETSTAIGGNSNWGSQDSERRATKFSMSLASASAAAASEPEPSDEGMADLGGNSNWSSPDFGSRATSFSMSLASVSAAAASEPEPSGEGMADLGGNSNWSSPNSGNRATTFSMSLASVSAAAASEPEPSGEGMVDLGSDVLIAQATAAEGGVETASQVVAHGDIFILPEHWAAFTSNQRKKYLKRRNLMGKK